MDIKGEEHVRHMFDSFCRKVLQNAASDYYDSISRRRKHEILLDDYWNLPYTLDKYSLDQEVYEVLGESIMFTDASIIAALNSLSAEGRTIVLAACVTCQIGRSRSASTWLGERLHTVSQSSSRS